MTFDWDFTLSILPSLAAATRVTIAVTLVAFTLALLGGLGLAVLLRMPVWVCLPVAASIEFIRSTPLLVQIFAAYFLLPELGVMFDPFTTGALVLGLHYACYVAQVFRGAIDGVPRGQWEAAAALGLRRGGILALVILPQAVPPAIPPLGNYLVAMFKDVPMLAAITLVELMYTANRIAAEKFLYVEPMTLVGLIYLVISLAAAFAIRRVEQHFAPARSPTGD
ncbi:MAG: ectoine/hydroxyectoine ABC transporter permease subunit EhuD [Acetobacteraceae bacterium]|nr:ectoine/hydroxyectoine ABC transporter permease subunit EhuD [Acetobacteraceae bacterium]